MSEPFARREYERGNLSEDAAGVDPLALFAVWLRSAEECSDIEDPYAMTLATVGVDGRPEARVVLLRGADERGFTFFTNYESGKGRSLANDSRAALAFYWGRLERQVRVEGVAEKVPPEESDAYFSSRPHRSKLGALVSRQSAVIPDRSSLESEMASLEAKYPEGTDVPRPDYWGGYRVIPETIEFWHGRRSRLHDRIRFRRERNGWTRERLAP